SLLERFGFGSYLDVVLTGGRTPTAIPERLAAERAFLAAQARRDSLLRTQPASPELEYLHSERARLLAHVVHHIGVDPGERVIELLRAHPVVPGAAVDGLRNALASVGLVPVGRGLAEVADEWLRHQATVADDHRRARATVEEIEVELADLAGRRDRLAAALSDARLAEAGAAEQLDLASRSVGAVEAELSVRAGEDSSRLQRFVAADQLRTQVEALGATLARAERDATAELDRATEAAGTAEVAFDRAQGAQGDLARRARQLAEELPIDRRPAGDRLATLEALAELLRDHAEVLRPAIDAAEVAVAAATAKVDGAFAEAEAAGTGAGGPRSDDVVDGFVSVLEKGVDEVIVLDEPFAGLDDALRPRLLELVLEHSGQLLLLTEDPELLGWAIGLPAAQATVAAADSVLNLWPRRADTKVTVPTPSARLSAGRH
ncbi:MAG: hypothetical protein ABIY48_13330, partial [Acidimicrobiales bacterium]